MKSPAITCPAGQRVRPPAGPRGCLCRAESAAAALRSGKPSDGTVSIIRADTSPASLTRFCEGEYTECPTWRIVRDRRLVSLDGTK